MFKFNEVQGPSLSTGRRRKREHASKGVHQLSPEKTVSRACRHLRCRKERDPAPHVSNGATKVQRAEMTCTRSPRASPADFWPRAPPCAATPKLVELGLSY